MKWINVNESLPEVGLVVLIYDSRYGEIGLGKKDEESDNGFYVQPFNRRSYWTLQVSKWCKIPQAKVIIANCPVCDDDLFACQEEMFEEHGQWSCEDDFPTEKMIFWCNTCENHYDGEGKKI